MATIGAVTLKLEAQHQSLMKGLSDSNKAMKETAGAGSQLASALKGSLLAIGVAMVASTLKSWTSEVFKSVTETYRLSDALGITTGSLQGLQAAGLLKAGVGAEEFNGILNHMIKGLGEASSGSGPASEALERLGLSGKLAGQHTDEAFRTIAERISKIKDPTQQARASIEIFGKEGQKLLPLFRSGAAGIDEATAKAKHFGTALSETDSAKLVDANEKFDEIGMAVDGVKNQIVVALAPAFGTIAEKILDLMPASDKWQSGAKTAIHAVGEGIGYLADAYKGLKVEVLAITTAIIYGMEGILYVVKGVAEGIIWVHNKMSDDQWTQPAWIDDSINAVDQWRQSMQDQTLEAFNAPSGHEAISQYFADIETKADATAKAMADKKASFARPLSDSFGDAHEKIDKELSDMAKQIGQFSLNEGQKKLFDLEGMGANKAQLELAKQYSDELDRLEKRKKETEDAKEFLKKQTEENPLSKYRDELTKMNKYLQDGLINYQQYAKGLSEANGELGKSLKDLTEDRKVEAHTRRMDFRGAGQAPKADPIKQLQMQQQKQQVESAKKAEWYLQQMWQFGLADQQSQPVVVDIP